MCQTTSVRNGVQNGGLRGISVGELPTGRLERVMWHMFNEDVHIRRFQQMCGDWWKQVEYIQDTFDVSKKDALTVMYCMAYTELNDDNDE